MRSDLTAKYLRLAGLATAAVCLGIGVPVGAVSAAGSPSTVHHVTGSWQELVPVLTTAYQPSASSATTGTYAGVGSTLWSGTWTGVTNYTIAGVANLVTGAGTGTIHETFTGRSPDGRSGTLGFVESYAIDNNGHVRIDARIVRSSGDFTGSRGEVLFSGSQVSVATGGGTYQGVWVLPRHSPPP